MGFEILLTVLFVLLLVNFVILDYTVSKMKKDRLNIDVVAAITALEMAVRKLNEKLRCETQSLSDYKQQLKRLEKRIDILEEGHPDTDIDYGEVDDHGEVVCVWFEGKKYVPEDKKAEDTNTFYANNEVVAETTRPEVKCCATCQHYRPGEGHTCALCYWLNVTKTRAATPESACHNYEKASAVLVPSDKDKVEYIRYDRMYKDMSGNDKAEQVEKQLDELRCKLQRLDLIASLGGCTAQEMRQRWEELMRDDS